jgi:hypothetical protein
MPLEGVLIVYKGVTLRLILQALVGLLSVSSLCKD